MTKYLISTLTAAAAMAVPAFSAELIGSWDFTSCESGSYSASYTSSASYTDKNGDTAYLVLSTGSSIGSRSGITGNYLNITSSASSKTTISLTNADVTLSEGISIVLTITAMSGSSGSIYASIETDSSATNHNYAAAIGESGDDTSYRTGAFYADGSIENTEPTDTGTIDISSYPYTVTLVFEGDTMYIYQDDILVSYGQMTGDHYNTINGTITDVAIGSWDDTSTSSRFTTLGVSSLEIYRGNIYATAPEPSMFGLFFGLGAIGLVATRRRKRA